MRQYLWEPTSRVYHGVGLYRLRTRHAMVNQNRAPWPPAHQRKEPRHMPGPDENTPEILCSGGRTRCLGVPTAWAEQRCQSDVRFGLLPSAGHAARATASMDRLTFQGDIAPRFLVPYLIKYH